MRVGRERRIGEEEQRSLLETGGEGGRSSKKDLLLPHTAADIVQNGCVVVFVYFDFYFFSKIIEIESKRMNGERDR